MRDDYHRPTVLSDALRLLASQPMVVAAGCTDLYPATTARALSGPVLDIMAISDLKGLRQTEEGWRIGATTTWSDIVRSDLPPAFDALKQAAREVGSAQIQNAGTLAGNLCTASPAGDGLPCMAVLDASVELKSLQGTRTLPLAEFLTGPRQTAMTPGELVTAITVPKTAAIGTSAFLKLGARRYLVISIAMVAARLAVEGDRVRSLSVAVGACSPTPARLTLLEDACVGVPMRDVRRLVTPERVAPSLSPIDDIRADAGYRIDAACEVTRRVLAALVGPLELAA